MSDNTHLLSQPDRAIPADDPRRKLTVVNTDDPTLRHVSVGGGTYIGGCECCRLLNSLHYTNGPGT
jgi:hypothetical protein